MVSFRELLPDNTDCNTYAHERINFQNTTRMAARLTTGGTLADLEYMGLLDRLVVVVCRDTGSTGIPTGIASASAANFLWWKHTRAANGGTRQCFTIRRPRTGSGCLKACFLLVAALSLMAAVIHVPWSFDAVTYRLPRCLYWLAEGRWYWIGTIDGRLDYSSCGLEWQMIPLILLTKTDRFLFLLSYLPFLLLPGLFYLGGRALGFARKPVLIWMWLLPCAYCIALQCSGLQNDGYTASYTAACLAFGGIAIRRRSRVACKIGRASCRERVSRSV